MVTNASITQSMSVTSGFIPEVWSDGVLAAVELGSKFQTRVTRAYEGDIKAYGNKVHVPRVSNLTTQTKSLSTGITDTIVFEAIAQSKQDITIDTHQYAAFLIEDVVEVQSKTDVRAAYEKKLGYALARGREVACASLVASLAESVGGLGQELTSDDYLAAWTKIAQAGLLETSPDPGEDFSLFLSPAAYAAALKVDVFTNSLYHKQSDAIDSVGLGDIYGFPVFISNLLTADSPGHDCAVFHRDAFALCVQKEVNVSSMWLISNLAWGVVSWNLFGKAAISYPIETPGSESLSINRGVWLKTL